MTVGLGIKLVLPDVAVTVSVCASLAAPAPIPERFTVWLAAFSLSATSLMGFNVGGSFTGLTVTVKARVTTLLLAPPSLTVTVMVAVPLMFDTGVRLNVPVAVGLV